MRKKATKAVSSHNRPVYDRFFVAPQSSSFTVRNRLVNFSRIELLEAPRSLIKIVFCGTALVIISLFLLLCVSYFLLGNGYILPRILLVLPAIIYLSIIAYLIGKNRYTAAAWMLISLYFILATIIVWSWSINTQIGLLTLGFVIILTGTLLGARFIMPVTIAVIVLLCYAQIAQSLAIIDPDITALAYPATLGDAIAYGTVFGIFALVTWLSRRQMEQALQRALGAEVALENEKKMLAIKLDERTRHLREVQLEEMQQLYRFAELGQLSTVVLHELANHLTILTLDIDDIEQRHSRSKAVINAKESIHHLDTMVDQVRHQLQESSEPEEFNVADILDDTIKTLNTKAAKNQVVLTLRQNGNRSEYRVIGDPLRLSHIVTILVTNAIEAYVSMKKPAARPVVMIELTVKNAMIGISIIDTGVGISPATRKKLFEPFTSTKENGMGIGLFIAKKMIETHFKGTISLRPSSKRTHFVIHIPVYRSKMISKR